MPARQQTMRATIAWSYQLLDAQQQRRKSTARTARLFGAAARLREEVAVALPPSYRALVETTIARIQAGMASPETFEQYYQEGQALSMPATIPLWCFL